MTIRTLSWLGPTACLIILLLSGGLFIFGRPLATSFSADPVSVSARASSHAKLAHAQLETAIENGEESTGRVWRLLFAEGIAMTGRSMWAGMLPWSISRDMWITVTGSR